MNISDQNNTPHGAKLASLVITLVLLALGAAHDARADTTDTTAVRKVLFLGDSMTGWMAERLNAYGEINGFEVATIVWDGSTISKWADTDGLADIIAAENPDAIMVCLGMNEMFEPFPEKRLSTPVEKLVDAFGDTPFLWIGPLRGPGKTMARFSTTGWPPGSEKATISRALSSLSPVRARPIPILRVKASRNGSTKSWSGFPATQT